MIRLYRIFKITGFSIFIFSVVACFTMQISMTGANIHPDSKTFSVDYFTTRASLAPSTAGQTFTDELKDIFQSQTSLQLTNGVGDLSFSGEITGYNTKPVAIPANETVAQIRLTIKVKVKYTNLLEPDNDFEQSFSDYRDYPSSNSLNSVENELIDEIFEAIIDKVFNTAVVNW